MEVLITTAPHCKLVMVCLVCNKAQIPASRTIKLVPFASSYAQFELFAFSNEESGGKIEPRKNPGSFEIGTSSAWDWSKCQEEDLLGCKLGAGSQGRERMRDAMDKMGCQHCDKPVNFFVYYES